MLRHLLTPATSPELYCCLCRTLPRKHPCPDSCPLLVLLLLGEMKLALNCMELLRALGTGTLGLAGVSVTQLWNHAKVLKSSPFAGFGHTCVGNEFWWGWRPAPQPSAPQCAGEGECLGGGGGAPGYLWFHPGVLCAARVTLRLRNVRSRPCSLEKYLPSLITLVSVR